MDGPRRYVPLALGFGSGRSRPTSATRQPPPGLLQEAAREVFAERGYEATTREIALRAGVSHKLIFRYFDSKENCSSTQS
ncbi:helix-turn-helix domain-containing protein [Mycobacterium avium]|uniref:helix-turn-helix domain-containing protein n=1 Tax=Mycobacterium avium TaxID=1764 RepID=UPI001CC5F20F